MKSVLWLLIVVAALINYSVLGAAQQAGKIPRIGYVSGGGEGRQVEGFRQGLRDLSYIEGKSILVEFRYAEGKLDRIPSLVAELVQLKVDVLVVTNTVAIQAAKQATQTIPIVMVSSLDPVTSGMVDSLARPGGNITGFYTLSRELSAKRLELLKETIPRISRVGVLWDGNAPGPTVAFKEYETAARDQKIPLQSLEVRGPNPDLDGAFRAAAKQRANALITVTNPTLISYRKRIVELAIKNRLPSMYETARWVEVGGLVSYAADEAAIHRRLAIFVDKILKGRKPADLPVEQAMKFEFVFNLITAKKIGLTIPPNVLVRADKVIR